jgi:hypothetical protein
LERRVTVTTCRVVAEEKFRCPDCRESAGINPLVVENRYSARGHWIMTGG